VRADVHVRLRIGPERDGPERTDISPTKKLPIDQTKTLLEKAAARLP
jgi:hypothetical protein